MTTASSPSPSLPQLALTISQRPRTAERLLKIERSFNETRSLGDFLREQGVISTEPRGIPAGWVAVGLSVGLALGGVLGLVAGVAITR